MDEVSQTLEQGLQVTSILHSGLQGALYPLVHFIPYSQGDKEHSKWLKPSGAVVQAREKALGVYLGGCPFRGAQVRKLHKRHVLVQDWQKSWGRPDFSIDTSRDFTAMSLSFIHWNSRYQYGSSPFRYSHFPQGNEIFGSWCLAAHLDERTASR